ncbi:hypothetical protein HU200_056511 [Digitaria exilis]|uniref:Uncharacterized protein n=1 Tax=Digitaria exilis TaxID=1010633 RepID=A0A835E5Y5_9POAL|nr:hypothetical protein HU200_056511 [Digitaria exilis]
MSTRRRCHRRLSTTTGRLPRSPATTPSSPPSFPRLMSTSSS